MTLKKVLKYPVQYKKVDIDNINKNLLTYDNDLIEILLKYLFVFEVFITVK